MTHVWSVGNIVAQLADVLLAWSWLFLLFLALWIAWEIYLLLKHIDYVSGLQWTFFQITVPEDAPQTPKAFENAIEVWGGIHKDPDLIERLFEGYFLPWYSCELQCTKNRARYIMVVPAGHAKFIEGVIYGQYPTAEVKEVADYAQEFSYKDIEKTFDMWGSEIVLVKDDIYPIRTYHEFADVLAEDDKYIDPHQSMVESFTNVNEGEHFWLQVLIKPIDAEDIAKWFEKGQERILELSGEKSEEAPGIAGQIASFLLAIPGELLKAFTSGPIEPSERKDQSAENRRIAYNPAENAEIEGILRKVSRTAFRTKIRVMHFAPVGKLHKPNYGKAIGVFKQFNSFHLNSVKPEKRSKTNGPNYILKNTRRKHRKQKILLDYQFRDFWGDKSGQMFSAEELATIYHFPGKYTKVPGIERAAAGLGSPPENLPYT